MTYSGTELVEVLAWGRTVGAVRVMVNGPEVPEQPEPSPTATATTEPDVGPTAVPRPPAKKPVTPAGKYTKPKFTG